MEILITDSAKEDLKGIREYYRELDVSETANNQISERLKKVERLIDHPKSGRIIPEFNDRQIREVISSPYRAVYLPTDHAIQIIIIWRSERDLDLPAT